MIQLGFHPALLGAFELRDPSERVSAIKRVISAEVRAVDPGVRIKHTDYFNHSFAPDMVLTWPSEARERMLFLRANPDPGWLRDDLQLVQRHHPMVLTLDALEPKSAQSDHQQQETLLLEAEAAQTDTWITDPGGLSVVAEARGNDAVMGLLGQALVRGGKGVSDGTELSRLAMSTTHGFEAAAALESTGTRAAVIAIEENLSQEQAGRLTRVMRAIWEGRGGDQASFPAVSSVGPLTDDDLTYLLTSLDSAPSEFWRRLGRGVSTAQIARLSLQDPSTALQHFMQENVHAMTGKGVRFTDRPAHLGEPSTGLRWVIDRGCLALRGEDWIAHIAARKTEELPTIEEARRVSLGELRRRARRAEVTVTRIEMARDDRVLSYESRDRLDVLEDPALAQFAQDLGGDTVDAVAVNPRSGGTIHVEFKTATAVAPTNSVLPVNSLLQAALPLIASVGESIDAALSEILRAGEFDEGSVLF